MEIGFSVAIITSVAQKVSGHLSSVQEIEVVCVYPCIIMVASGKTSIQFDLYKG